MSVHHWVFLRYSHTKMCVHKGGNDQYRIKNQLRWSLFHLDFPQTPSVHQYMRGIIRKYCYQINTIKDFTCEWPSPTSNWFTVKGACCKFRPGGKCAVIFAGNVTLLYKRRHGSCPLHAVTDIGRVVVLWQARNSWKGKVQKSLYCYIYCIILYAVSTCVLWDSLSWVNRIKF